MSVSPGVVAGLADAVAEVQVRRVVQLDGLDPGGAGVRSLVNALVGAAARLEEEMLTGKEAFGSVTQRQSAYRLIGQVGKLMDLLKNHPAPPDPSIRYIPACPICHADPGQHWAHECPMLDRHGQECTYDYRKNEVVYYQQIVPFAERLKPHPDDVFTCVVCRSRWKGIVRDELIEAGHDFGEPERREMFNSFKQRSLR